MSKKEIEIKTWLTRDEMVKYLEDLAVCLAQGKVVLQRGSDFLEFSPAQSMELELEGVHKKGQQKISIEISWRQVVLEPTEEPLKISTDSPLPPAQPEAVASEAAPEQSASESSEAGAVQVVVQDANVETGKSKSHKHRANN